MNIRILPYQPQYQPYYEKLNKAWIEEFFTIEPIDSQVLENPEESILSKGGAIFFAEYQGRIIGTAALKLNEPGVLELTKMAVAREYQGLGAGKLLCKTAIQQAAEKGAEKLVLYTHSSLQTAIAIYKKLGFQEVPVEPGKYARADVKMEILHPKS